MAKNAMLELKQELGVFKDPQGKEITYSKLYTDLQGFKVYLEPIDKTSKRLIAEHLNQENHDALVLSAEFGNFQNQQTSQIINYSKYFVTINSFKVYLNAKDETSKSMLKSNFDLPF